MYWLTELRALITQELADIVRHALAPLGPYLRRLGFGSMLILLSSIAFGAALLFLLIACFLALSTTTTSVVAALWTALIATGGGGFLLTLGIRAVRRPRTY